MSAANQLYQEVILDHNRKPRNWGRLADASHHAEGLNPLCGDHIWVYLRLNDARIDAKQKKHWFDHLVTARKEFYNRWVKEDVHRALFASFEDEAQQLLEKYLDEVEAALDQRQVTDPMTASLFGEYSRLEGPAADSSLVRERGDRNQFMVGVSTTYRFDFKM